MRKGPPPGPGRRALERAFAALYGRSTRLLSMRLGGMTDRAIVRTALGDIAGLTDPEQIEAAIDAVLAVYVPLLEDELAVTVSLALLPGVKDVLDAVDGRPGVAVGLGTGNVREGARLKLSHVGIFDRFAFGGFGCDHEDRAEILRIAATRGAARVGAAVRDCRVVVVGDTAHDVAAARAIGAEAVTVATGGFTGAELIAAGASCAFDDLTAAGVLPALLNQR
jgi:phosphoglycolate phosphatase-like HAD superfamily hydrolase